MKPTIFITSFHILISRNILATGLLEYLADTARIVILCPDKKGDFFKKEFGYIATIETISLTSHSLDVFLRYLSLASLSTQSLTLKRKTEMNGSGVWVTKVIGYSVFRSLFRVLNTVLTPRGPFAVLCKKYNPALIFATDVGNDFDVELLAEAKRQKIATVGMVRSWDNLTSKGVVRVIPDRLVVNNEQLARESEQFHGISRQSIEIVGVPHYDRYFNSPKSGFSDSLKKIGLVENRPYVLFAPAGDRYIRDNTVDPFVLDLLERTVPASFDILVRLPPADGVKSIETSLRPTRVHVYRPGGNFEGIKSTELTGADDALLIDMLRGASLVVTGPSTMCIDAAIFDKPMILIGFDGEKNRPYLQSIRRYYDYNHFVPIIQSGGAPLAKNPAEFQRLLDVYISDLSRDSAGRRRIVAVECQYSDSGATKRLASVLRAAFSKKI